MLAFSYHVAGQLAFWLLVFLTVPSPTRAEDSRISQNQFNSVLVGRPSAMLIAQLDDSTVREESVTKYISVDSVGRAISELKEAASRGHLPKESRDWPLQNSQDAYIAILRALLVDEGEARHPIYGEALAALSIPVPEEAWPLLDEALTHERLDVQYHALCAVHVAGEAAIPNLPSFAADIEQSKQAFEDYLLSRKLAALGETLKRGSWGQDFAKQELIRLGPAALPVVEQVATAVSYWKEHADVLAAMGPEALPYLENALVSSKGTIYTQVCGAIASMGPAAQPSVPYLLQVLSRYRVGPACEVLYTTLVATEVNVVSLLPSMLEDESLHPGAYWIIQKLGPEASEMRERLITMWEHDEAGTPWDELALVRALAAIDGSDAFELEERLAEKLAGRFIEGDAKAKQTLTPILMKLGPAAAPAIPALISALDDREVNAKKPLVAIGEVAAPALIKELAATDNLNDAMNLEDVLVQIGDPSIPHLIDALDLPTYRTAYALAKMGKTSISALRGALENPNVHVRRRVALALGQHDTDSGSLWTDDYNPEATQALIACLGDSDAGVTLLAIQGIANRRVHQATEALETLANNPDEIPIVRQAAEQALSQFEIDRSRQESKSVRAKSEPKKPLPEYAITATEIPVERGTDREFRYHLSIEEDVLALESKYLSLESTADGLRQPSTQPHEFSAGINPETLYVSWVIPDVLLQIRWSRYVEDTPDPPVTTTLLIDKLGDRWREVFRTGIREGYRGYTMSHDEEHLYIRWTGDDNQFQLDHSYRTFSGGMNLTAGLELSALGVYENRYHQSSQVNYSLSQTWTCRITESGLAFEGGIGQIELGEHEFPIEDIAQILQDRNVTVDSLRADNPWLQGETLCTGVVVYTNANPPRKAGSDLNYILPSYL